MGADKYEAVIGLEVHIQLLTKSKAYSSDSTEYGAVPNTNVSVISLGHPGVLPMVNTKMVEYGVKLGIACNCQIHEQNEYARKNYFYTDMPKGYQISQHTTPICNGGYITIKNKEGKSRDIELTRIHMEEDSGKSIHDQDPFNSLIDLNRAGVPLLEMVTEPVIKNSDEAYQFLYEVRKLVRYLEICDGNMEEGSMRCDANISIREKGATELGEKVEVKNMNSIRNVQRALEFEIMRQIEALDKNEKIYQETRTFDATTGKTIVMRTKEMANDYRYFPEPDLPMVIVDQEYIDSIKESMPALPNELYKKYTSQLGLSDYDATVITDSKSIALYFDELLGKTKQVKAAVNWIMGPVKSYLNENAKEISEFSVTTDVLAELIDLIEKGTISHSIATQKVFPLLIQGADKSPLEVATDNNWIKESDEGSIGEFVKEALAKYPDKVAEYNNGKVGLIGLFMGEVMKLSKGKADPKIASELVKKSLEESR